MQAILLPAAVNLATAPVSVLVVLGVLLVIEVALDLVALVDLYRRPTERVVLENKWIWLAIILLGNLLGAIVYLAAGRKPVQAGNVVPWNTPSARSADIVDSLYGPRDGTDQK